MKNRTVKRVLALAVTAALAGSMVACGGGDGAQSEGSQEETASQEEAADGAQSEETADADSGSGESASGETYKIGVIQYMPPHGSGRFQRRIFAALDDLGISYEEDQQNAAGETSTCQTIAQNLASAGNDLIFAIRDAGGAGYGRCDGGYSHCADGGDGSGGCGPGGVQRRAGRKCDRNL